MDDTHELTSAIAEEFLRDHLPPEIVERVMGFLVCEVEWCSMHRQEHSRYCRSHHEECRECGIVLDPGESYYCVGDNYCENHVPRCEECDRPLHDYICGPCEGYAFLS